MGGEVSREDAFRPRACGGPSNLEMKLYDQLKQKQRAVEDHVGVIERERDALLKALKDLEAEAQQVTDDLTRTQRELADTQDALTQATLESAQLRAERDEFRDQADSAYTVARETEDRLTKELQKSRDERDATEVRLAESTALLEGAEAHIAELNAEVDEKTKKLAESRTSAAGLHAKLFKAAAGLGVKRRQVDALVENMKAEEEKKAQEAQEKVKKVGLAALMRWKGAKQKRLERATKEAQERIARKREQEQLQDMQSRLQEEERRRLHAEVDSERRAKTVAEEASKAKARLLRDTSKPLRGSQILLGFRDVYTLSVKVNYAENLFPEGERLRNPETGETLHSLYATLHVNSAQGRCKPRWATKPVRDSFAPAWKEGGELILDADKGEPPRFVTLAVWDHDPVKEAVSWGGFPFDVQSTFCAGHARIDVEELFAASASSSAAAAAKAAASGGREQKLASSHFESKHNGGGGGGDDGSSSGKNVFEAVVVLTPPDGADPHPLGPDRPPRISVRLECTIVPETALQWVRGYAADTENIARLLRWADADVERRGPNGKTPLMTCAAKGQSEAAELLLRADADPNARDGTGMTAVHLCATHNKPRVLKRLLADQRCKPNALTLRQRTALMLAASRDHHEVADILVRAGADRIALRDEDGFTPLLLACWHGSRRTATLLMNQGSDDRHARGLRGESALMLAAAQGHADIVEALRVLDPDTLPLADRLNKTAADYARVNGFKELSEHLQRVIDEHKAQKENQPAAENGGDKKAAKGEGEGEGGER